MYLSRISPKSGIKTAAMALSQVNVTHGLCVSVKKESMIGGYYSLIDCYISY